MKTLDKFLSAAYEKCGNQYAAMPLILKSIPEIRAEYDAMAETARKRFEDLQASEAKCEELAARLSKMTTERDDIQLRLHAIDHAYSERQSKVRLVDNYDHVPGSGSITFTNASYGVPAATLLQQAQAMIERQRQFIRTLYTSRNKKKSK